MASDESCGSLPTLQKQRVKDGVDQRAAQNALAKKLQAAVNHTQSYVERVQTIQQEQQDLYIRRVQMNLPRISTNQGHLCAPCSYYQGLQRTCVRFPVFQCSPVPGTVVLYSERAIHVLARCRNAPRGTAAGRWANTEQGEVQCLIAWITPHPHVCVQ